MSSKPLTALATALATALVISMAVNAWDSYHLHSTRRALAQANAVLATAQEDATLAQAAAQSCSASVADLAEQAAARALANATARESAQAHASQHNAAADRILATAPAAPGDDCTSAQARVSAILAARPGGGS